MTYHPLLDPIAVLVFTSTIVGFTPARSLSRIACLPVLGALTWHCILNCPFYIARSAWASAVGGYTISSFLHYLDVAVLSKLSFDDHGASRDPSKIVQGSAPRGSRQRQATPSSRQHAPETPRSQVLQRVKFGLSVFFSWRFVNTPHQVRNLPQLDGRLRASRARFLCHTALTIVICYILLDIMDSSSDAEVSAKFYTPDKVGVISRIAEVSLEELVMRLFAALGLCTGLIAFQRGVYNVAAFFCVATGMSDPGDWPPFNGPLTETYSLRRFWSTFWHQINTHRLNAISSFLLHDVLRLSRGTKFVRYLRIWLIFLLSGIMHVAIDVASGIPLQHSGAMKFFAIQPLGVFIEDMFLALYNSGSESPSIPKTTRLWQRCIGWAWLGLWMAWTAPAYLYPIMAQEESEENGGVVPVSVIAYAESFIG
ncbi:membrane bound O-acyl transferase family-domain-containing protein [Apiospora marii]|uniref:membrane bound O-acyl transferase family-domain-containing protein n=1 Tax=Apiospora marii TaxID=335849 RepID=UPI00312CE33F